MSRAAAEAAVADAHRREWALVLAALAYQRALELTGNDVERRHLLSRLGDLPQ